MSELIEDFIKAGDVEVQKLTLSREHLDSLPWEQFAIYNAALAAYNDIVSARDELTRLRADNAMLVEALGELGLLVMQEAWNEADELARSLRYEFTGNGKPKATLAKVKP